jgi:hypothetical protein
MNWQSTRVGEVLVGRTFDSTRLNHVCSGFLVTAVLPEGLRVRRIHAMYLTPDPVESWTLRWDQLQRKDENGTVNDLFKVLPEGAQLPLL